MSGIDRETFNQWLLLDTRPDKLGKAREAPPAWDVWLERAYGKTEAKNYKILMHPFFKRWCLWEKHQIEGRGTVWGIKYICCAAPEPDRNDLYWRTPVDYQDDPILTGLAQFIGDYREFTQDDFYELYGFERKHHTAKEVIEHSQANHVKQRAEGKANLREAIDSSNDYWFDYEMNLVNQEFGSGQRMKSYPTVEAHAPKTFRVEKEGYIVQAPVGSLVGAVLKTQEATKERLDISEEEFYALGEDFVDLDFNWAATRPKPAHAGQSWLADYKDRNDGLFGPIPELEGHENPPLTDEQIQLIDEKLGTVVKEPVLVLSK